MYVEPEVFCQQQVQNYQACEPTWKFVLQLQLSLDMTPALINILPITS